MELSKDHQAPATLPGLCYVQTARQPTHLESENDRNFKAFPAWLLGRRYSLSRCRRIGVLNA